MCDVAAPILTGEKPDKSLFSDPPPSRLPQSRPNTSSGTDSQNTGPGSAPSPIHNPGSQGPPSVGSPDDKGKNVATYRLLPHHKTRRLLQIKITYGTFYPVNTGR